MLCDAISVFCLALFQKMKISPPPFLNGFLPLCRYLLGSLTVTAGEHDLRHKEEEEQTLHVKSITRHPKFNVKKPMDYDIALLRMNGHFKYGNLVYNYLPVINIICNTQGKIIYYHKA